MEDPCLFIHRALAAGAGLHVMTVEVDAEGASAHTAARHRAIVVTPAHQFPLGMTSHRRAARCCRLGADPTG